MNPAAPRWVRVMLVADLLLLLAVGTGTLVAVSSGTAVGWWGIALVVVTVFTFATAAVVFFTRAGGGQIT